MRRNVSKSVLSIILAVALTFSAAGCSKKKEERTSRETAETVKLATPTGLQYKYLSSYETLKLSWDPVAGVSMYEIEINGETHTAAMTMTDISHIPQGSSGVIKIRSVKGANVSDWASFDYAVGYYPKAPVSVKSTIIGNYIYVYWNKVNDIDGYLFDSALYGQAKVTDPHFLVPITEGKTDTINISSYINADGKTYYSDPLSVSIQNPTFNLSMDWIDEMGTCILDYSRLMRWIELNKFDYTTYSSNGDVYVVVSEPDPANNGFLGRLGRAIDSFFEEFIDNIPSALGDILAGKLFDGQPLKEGAKESIKDTSKSGFISAIGAAFSDISINVIYRFNENELDLPPASTQIYMLKRNRGNITQMLEESASSYTNGYYLYTLPTSASDPNTQSFAVWLTSDGDYWVLNEMRSDTDPQSPLYRIG